MTNLSDHVNGVSPELFGELTTAGGARNLSDLTPVLATPAAFATGVALGATAYAAGFAFASACGFACPRPK